MKIVRNLFLIVVLMAGLSFMTACSDDDEDHNIQIYWPPTWEINMEKTEGQFTFQWSPDDEKYYKVSYDFIFENEICKAASFTVKYKTEEEAVKAWKNISYEGKQVCTMTGTSITYPDQYGYIGSTCDFISEDIWKQYITFKVENYLF